MLEIKFRAKEKEKWKNLKRKGLKKWEKWKEQNVLYHKNKRKEQAALKEKRTRTNKRKYRRVQFIDTPIGHYMYVYAPVEFQMLLKYISQTRQSEGRNPVILTEHIELLALKTGNPAFKTTTFRKAVIAYREYGMNPPKKAHWTLRDALHFAKFSNYIHKQMKECEREIP